MGFVRAAVFVSIVAIGGAAYIYRDDVIRVVGPHIGMGTAAKTAETQASPAAGAQPQGRRGRANPGRGGAGGGHAGHARSHARRGGCRRDGAVDRLRPDQAPHG